MAKQEPIIICALHFYLPKTSPTDFRKCCEKNSEVLITKKDVDLDSKNFNAIKVEKGPSARVFVLFGSSWDLHVPTLKQSSIFGLSTITDGGLLASGFEHFSID